jgi:hypothetical protein
LQNRRQQHRAKNLLLEEVNSFINKKTATHWIAVFLFMNLVMQCIAIGVICTTLRYK